MPVQHKRAIQGNCSSPDGAVDGITILELIDSGELLPLKPFQCLLVVNNAWLMLTGLVWVDNLYLQLRRNTNPDVAFISNRGRLPHVDDMSRIYVTNVTFQLDASGASAIANPVGPRARQNAMEVHIDGAPRTVHPIRYCKCTSQALGAGRGLSFTRVVAAV